MWGMMMFRPYLIGVHFTSWGDHKPLLPLYNEMSKAAPVRVARHRNKVQDLRFKDKYLRGKSMPCDYASRHAPHRGPHQGGEGAADSGRGRGHPGDEGHHGGPAAGLSMEVLWEVAEQDEMY